jgi:hypothetical protein
MRWWWQDTDGGDARQATARPAARSIYEDRLPPAIDDDGQDGWTPIGELDLHTGRFIPDPGWRGNAGGWRPLSEWQRRR